MSAQEALVVVSAAALAGLISSSVESAVERSLRRNLTTILAHVAEGEEWVTPAVAAKLYGRHRSTLSRWSRAGLLPKRVLAGSVYYSRHAVARLAGQSGG